MSKGKTILGNVVFAVLIAALLLGSLMFALNQNPDKTVLGFRAYHILSGSMEPELSKGDLVIVKAVPAEELQNGDIVTYYPTDQAGTTVTHRVVSTLLKDGQVLIETKGDAVQQPDPIISGNAVIGVVTFHIPLLGGIISWIQTHLVLSIVIVVLAAAVWIGIGSWHNKGKKKKAQPVQS